jgi:hypothetical protein
MLDQIDLNQEIVVRVVPVKNCILATKQTYQVEEREEEEVANVVNLEENLEERKKHVEIKEEKEDVAVKEDDK